MIHKQFIIKQNITKLFTMKNIKLSHIINTLIIVTYIAIMGACSKDDAVAGAENQKPETIYVAGYKYNSTLGIRVATVWKNGVATTLSNSTNGSEVRGMVVVGQDVYCIGYQYDQANVLRGMYWKNGQEISLSSVVGGNYEVTGICAIGNDVYVSVNDTGFINIGIGGFQYARARLWKNGQPISSLNTPNNDPNEPFLYAQTSCVFASGNKVTIGGKVLQGTVYKGTYWQTDITGANKTEVNLTQDNYINGITNIGNDVYSLGNMGNKPKYWKNSTALALSDDNIRTDIGNIIAIGTDTYAVGSEIGTAGAEYKPKYWKNTTGVYLNQGTDTEATCITNNGTDIYIAGNYKLNGLGLPSIKLWKNNNPIPFENGKDCRVNAIVVTN
jgi:hypothetical protein